MEKSKVVFFDRRPESNNRPPSSSSTFPNTILDREKKNSKNIKSSSLKKYSTTYRKNKNSTYSDYTRTNRKPPIEAKQIKVKTIMFPNDEKEYHFNEEYKCLNKQKEELKELYENMLIKLNEEDKLRDEEIRLHTINMNANLENLSKKNKNLKKNNYNLTKKYMDLKYDTNQNNQKLKDQMEITKLQGEALRGNIDELLKKVKKDKELNKKDFDRRTRQVANSLRTQVKTKEETANLAMKQFTDIQNMYEEKINEAKNKIKLIENKYLVLKEGVFNEEEHKKKINEIEESIKIYRMKMKEFEAYINEIKQLTEGD
jgi:DNA repair exonuclease SbcCD ATPase subunit